MSGHRFGHRCILELRSWGSHRNSASIGVCAGLETHRLHLRCAEGCCRLGCIQHRRHIRNQSRSLIALRGHRVAAPRGDAEVVPGLIAVIGDIGASHNLLAVHHLGRSLKPCNTHSPHGSTLFFGAILPCIPHLAKAGLVTLTHLAHVVFNSGLFLSSTPNAGLADADTSSSLTVSIERVGTGSSLAVIRALSKALSVNIVSFFVVAAGL